MCGAPSFRLEVPPWGPQRKGPDVGACALGNSRVCPRLVKLRGRPRMKQPPAQVEPRPAWPGPQRRDKGLRGPGSGQRDRPSGLRSGEPGRAVGPVGARPLVVSSASEAEVPVYRPVGTSPRSWKRTMEVRGSFWILLVLLLRPEPGTASLPLLTDSLIQALAALEEKAPVPEAGGSASVQPLWGNPQDPIHVFLLDRKSRADTKLEGAELNPELRTLISEVAHHSVHGQQELGVVLAPDGSTVAVEPLLAGLVAGKQGRRAVPLPWDTWDSRDTTFPVAEDTHSSLLNASARPPSSLDSLLGVTLARNLGLAFLQGPQNRSRPGLGSDGCWDQLSAPRNFTLLDPEASPLTVAFLNGALDGLILGDYLNRTSEPQPALSHLLSQYYGKGVAGNLALHSSSRRQNAAPLAATPVLAQQVWGALLLLQRLEPEHPQLKGLGQEELLEVAMRAAREFTEFFLGCPAIHPRCRWGAAPYRGKPKPLQLPLANLFVHHTYNPGAPCTGFRHCARDLRSMQLFHQVTRGWDDIGYSFVVGSDGYVYEGRGWHWLGAHTRGHNSRGFGVSIIGDYSHKLPSERALRVLSQDLPRCAVRAGLLRPDYALLGHRQLVPTECPGEALFQQIRSWPHFSETLRR
ncbi:N-acetylmuramoyl-L-alanine amidase [Suncus etruscus]|uniref:N-acetylmuramoyl-L-alanine amidase n=1 Tax=Suncus etruscus TaxID=109475 RepID=UPI00210F3919|nr:N-acetylmuramoyl-L-alanine amidase [Suncus etruscus]